MDEKYFFNNSRGYKLAGILKTPQKSPNVPIVIFSHGFDSGKDSPRGLFVADELLKSQIGVFLIDFTGHGESEGSKEESTGEQQTDDLKCAIDLISTIHKIKIDKIGLNGASSGGLVVLNFLIENKQDSIKAVVLRGPRTNGMEYHANKIQVPIRIVQGEYDPLLPFSKKFYDKLICDKDFNIINSADHLFSTDKYLSEVADLTVQWFSKHML